MISSSVAHLWAPRWSHQGPFLADPWDVAWTHSSPEFWNLDTPLCQVMLMSLSHFLGPKSAFRAVSAVSEPLSSPSNASTCEFLPQSSSTLSPLALTYQSNSAQVTTPIYSSLLSTSPLGPWSVRRQPTTQTFSSSWSSKWLSAISANLALLYPTTLNVSPSPVWRTSWAGGHHMAQSYGVCIDILRSCRDHGRHRERFNSQDHQELIAFMGSDQS